MAKYMAKSHLKPVTPTTVNRTVTPRRLPNRDLRTREHLTEAEVERLMKAASGNRYGHRDATMVLVAYRHGLRASELVDLRWDQVDFRTATLHVRRVKKGTPSTHPIGLIFEVPDVQALATFMKSAEVAKAMAEDGVKPETIRMAAEFTP